MGEPHSTAVLLMAYGGPDALEDIPAYLLNVRHGRPIPQEQLDEITQRYRLIGGKSNPRVRLYNTCFPYKYDFNKEPEKIMREVIDSNGIKAIKIWPFDGAARRDRSDGASADQFEVTRGLRCANQ